MGFCLHKGAFVDALALRYGWPPHSYSHEYSHDLYMWFQFYSGTCPLLPPWWIPVNRHNEIRDLTVCNEVTVEPSLQEVTNESMMMRSAITTEGATLDVAPNGFWGGRYEKKTLHRCQGIQLICTL